MANLTPITSILNQVKSSIANADKDIWYGSTAKDVKLYVESLLSTQSDSATIPTIQAQITSLEEALKHITYLESLVERYARAYGIYQSSLYTYRNNNQEISFNELRMQESVMNNAKVAVERKQQEIEQCFSSLRRLRVLNSAPLREELPIYSINLNEVQDQVILNGLKKAVLYLEDLISSLKDPIFDSKSITKQSVAPYRSITVKVYTGNYRNMVVSNINDIINFINRMISRIEIHLDNITMFENNESVEIPLDDNGASVTQQTTETKEVTYDVKKGDTLSAIAATYGISWQTIYEANKNKIPDGDPRKLKIGTNLVIPGKTEVVKNVDVDSEIIGNEKLEASSDIPTIKSIIDFSEVSNSNWGVDCNEMVDGEYSAPMPLKNGKMVDKNGNVFYVSSKMSSYYNNGVYESTGGRSGHTGTDFTTGPNDYGTEVSSLGSGIVISESDVDNGGLGKYVKVLHEVIDDEGKVKYVVSTYGHLSSNSVKVGDIIGSDESIGKIGSTGNSSGAHLHLEMIDVNLTEDEMRGKTKEEVLSLVKQKGIADQNSYKADSYYDMGVYFKNKKYLK